MIKAFLFDLDDTLLDRGASVEPFAKRLYMLYHLNHIPYQEYWEYFKRLDNRGYAEKQEVFQALVTEYAFPVSVDELMSDFQQNAWKGCRKYLFPDAQDVLRELRTRSYKLGVITNGPKELQYAKLLESGLASLMNASLVSGQEKVKKPDREIFIRAVERLGVRVSDSVFVGDDPETDIEGADSAGMKTVWIKRYRPWPENLTITPHYTIASLTELLSIKF